MWLVLGAPSLMAAVWESTSEWSDLHTEQFEKWIQNDITSTIFSDPSSVYYGIETDCADSVLALRIIFAHRNGLSFYIGKQNPSNRFSSSTIRYDRYPPDLRLKYFINDVLLNFSSEDLAYDLTYSIAIDKVTAGDIYIYEDQNVRHTYLIKEKQENGNLILWYSTVPRKVRTLQERIGMPAKAFDKRPYGFRRFRFPQYFKLNEATVPQLSQDNDEQYQLLSNLGPNETMKEIRRRLAIRHETFSEALNRRMANSCVSFRARIELLKDTQSFFEKNKYRCLTTAEYDLYSTPSRDSTIYSDLAGLKQLWLKIRASGIEIANDKMAKGLDYLAGLSRQGRQELSQLCPHIAPISWKDYLHLYPQGRISSSPYAPLAQRWGNAGQDIGEAPPLSKCLNH